MILNSNNVQAIIKYRTPIIIGILLLVIVVQRACRPEPEKETEYRDTTIYSTTTIAVPVAGPIQYYPQPYAVYDTVHDTIFRTHKDTVDAIIDYSLVRKYNLPLFDDTLGKINVLASVQYNKIAEWNYEGKIYNKHTIIEKTRYVMEEKRNKVFIGLQAGYLIPENNVILAPTLALLTKKDILTQVSYDPLNKAAQIGIFWKIKFKQP